MNKWIIFLLLAVSASLWAGEPLVRSGMKIAFFGDTITSLGNYPAGYINLTVRGLEANGIPVKKIPAGLGWMTSGQYVPEFKKRVLEKKPDWVTIQCGRSDLYKKGDPAAYRKNMEEIVSLARKAGIRIWILGLTPVSENPDADANKPVDEMNRFLRKLASETGSVYVDVTGPLNRKISECRKEFPDYKGNFVTSWENLTPEGNLVAAETLLQEFGLDAGGIARAHNTWKTIPYTERLPVSLEEYLLLADKAFARNLTVAEYMKERIQSARNKDSTIK